MIQRTLLSLIAPFAFAACGVGTLSGPTGGGDDMGGGDDDIEAAADAAPLAREYAVNVTPSLGEINLGEQMSFTATVSSENFAGPVTLDLAGALPDWDVTYEPAQTLTLAENQSVDVIVTLTIPTNGTPGDAAPLAFNVDGELGTRSANSTMTVANRVKFAIEMGSGNGPHGGMSGTYPVNISTEIVIANDDLSVHRIHSEPHQAGSMAQGESYVYYFQETGNIQAYCHEHGDTGTITFQVEQ